MYSCVPGCMCVHHVIRRDYSRACCWPLSHPSKPGAESPHLMEAPWSLRKILILGSYSLDLYWNSPIRAHFRGKKEMESVTLCARCENSMYQAFLRIIDQWGTPENHVSVSGEAAVPRRTYEWRALDSYISSEVSRPGCLVTDHRLHLRHYSSPPIPRLPRNYILAILLSTGKATEGFLKVTWPGVGFPTCFSTAVNLLLGTSYPLETD